MKINGTLLKSDNALNAESEGRFVASEIARRLGGGLTAAIVAEVAADFHDGEWHHVSKYAHEVKYYNLRMCAKYFAKPGPRARIAALKATAKAAKSNVIVHEGLTVEWIEWTGSFRRPKANHKKASGCKVELKGQFATVTLTTGETFRKKIGANGFSFRKDADAKVAANG